VASIFGKNVYAGPGEPYLFGRLRTGGPEPERRCYRSFASFSDPDGNGWLFQEVTMRLAGRVDPATTTYASANDLRARFGAPRPPQTNVSRVSATKIYYNNNIYCFYSTDCLVIIRK
jgi:hypothetical protein